jgi:hypothetical protein
MKASLKPRELIFNIKNINGIPSILDGYSDESVSGNRKEIDAYLNQKMWNADIKTKLYKKCRFSTAIVGKNSVKLNVKIGDVVVIHKEGTPVTFVNGIQCSKQFVRTLNLKYEN